ncbi:MAG: hypothetical protein E6R08_10245 [Nevskiaceae bacterium]|nr:MAG: hypothetical protein E6R08_10245 [Nevskiaceae bacterium]
MNAVAPSHYRPEHVAWMAGRAVYCLDMLPPPAQRAAMANLLSTEAAALSRSFAAARHLAKSNLDAAINDPYFISALLRRVNFVRKIQGDADLLRRHILANLCEFDILGRYRPYFVEAANPHQAGDEAAVGPNDPAAPGC